MNAEGADDHDLVRRLRQGDERAFRELVERRHRVIYTTALGFLRSASDAEDITQEVFLEAFESIADFKEQSSLGTWLHRIAVTKSLDLLRRRKRRKRFAVLVALFGEDGALTTEPVDDLHPGVLLEDRERAAIFFSAVDRLPEQQRIAYTLHNIDGMSMKETAEVMGLTLKATESLTMRAKANLRKHLRRYYLDR